MKTALIINPRANHGQAERLIDNIISLISEHVDPILFMTKRAGHAVELARKAIDQGADLVISIGGDGTVHEVVNGMVIDGKSEATLGIIPIGSGNDLAFGMNFSKEIKQAVSTVFDGRERWLDLARIEDDHDCSVLATNSIGIGFDAIVNIQSRAITRVHGFSMYALATLRTIALYFQAPQVRMRFDDEVVEQQILLLAIGLGPRVGGGFYLTPDALHNDDLVDSCTVDPVSRLTMLSMLPKVMRGTHTTSKYVKMRRSRLIEVQSEAPLPIHVDGEIFAFHDDNVRRLTVTSLARVLPVITPKR